MELLSVICYQFQRQSEPLLFNKMSLRKTLNLSVPRTPKMPVSLKANATTSESRVQNPITSTSRDLGMVVRSFPTTFRQGNTKHQAKNVEGAVF